MPKLLSARAPVDGAGERQIRKLAGARHAPAAKMLEAVGVPTVFVDALPFLWTSGDTDWLPAHVSVYCAQRCPELPQEARDLFAQVDTLRWVGAVVPDDNADTDQPVPASETDPCRTLVVLGGLRSPQLDDVTIYPRLVVPPVLAALRRRGFTSVHVCGNVPDELVEHFATDHGQGLRVTSGPLGRGEFGRALREAGLVLTQPGLMTLLEAGAAGTPLVRLPPQNVAGIFQTWFHQSTVIREAGASWPEFVVSEQEAVAARVDGELVANEVVYGGIARGLSRIDEVHLVLAGRIEDVVGQALQADPACWTGFVRTVGTDGADEVAGHLFTLAERGTVGRITPVGRRCGCARRSAGTRRAYPHGSYDHTSEGNCVGNDRTARTASAEQDTCGQSWKAVVREGDHRRERGPDGRGVLVLVRRSLVAELLHRGGGAAV